MALAAAVVTFGIVELARWTKRLVETRPLPLTMAAALVVGGLAIAQLLPPFPGVPWGRHIIGTPLILLGCAVSVVSYSEWRASQQALRHGQPLPRSHLPQILAIAITAIGLAAAVIALVSGVRTP